MIKKYSLLLFDLDNTLVDFEKAEETALEKTFAHFGVPCTEEGFAVYQRVNKALWILVEAGKLTTDFVRVERFAQFLAERKLSGDPVAFSEEYIRLLGEVKQVYPGALELIKQLRVRYKIAVVTNGVWDCQICCMERTGLMPLCDALVVSEKAGAAKPSPVIFEIALEQAGHTDKATTLMIGDSLASDIQGGVNFGCDTVWFNPEKLKNTSGLTPTYEVSGFDDLLKLL